MADDSPQTGSEERHVRHPRRGGFVGGIVLIVLGGLMLLERFFPEFRLEDYWPLILIAVGAALLLTRRS